VRLRRREHQRPHPCYVGLPAGAVGGGTGARQLPDRHRAVGAGHRPPLLRGCRDTPVPRSAGRREAAGTGPEYGSERERLTAVKRRILWILAIVVAAGLITGGQ